MDITRATLRPKAPQILPPIRIIHYPNLKFPICFTGNSQPQPSNICPVCWSECEFFLYGTARRTTIEYYWLQKITCTVCGATWDNTYQSHINYGVTRELSKKSWQTEVQNGVTHMGYIEWTGHQKKNETVPTNEDDWDGSHCPKCLSQQHTVGSIEVDNQHINKSSLWIAMEKITCTCEATWNRLYLLVGYTDLEQGSFSEKDWQVEVSNGGTCLGYVEWVEQWRKNHQ